VPTAVEEAGEETLGRHRKVGRLKVWPAGRRRKRESERTVATGAPPAAMAAGARRQRDGESRALRLQFLLAAQLVAARWPAAALLWPAAAGRAAEGMRRRGAG